MWKLIRHLVLSILLYGVALYLVHRYTDGWLVIQATKYNVFLTFGILAAIFWVVNNVVKVILRVLTIPLKYLTLGLFSLVLNMLMLYVFEYLVNNSSVWVIIHLWTVVQVFILSLAVTVLAFLVKKIT